MPSSPIVQLLEAFSLAGAVFALWKGGPAERFAAGAILANIIVSAGLDEVLGLVDGLVRFSIDGMTALVLLAITLRYAAPWMTGLMLLYAGQFSLHAYYLVVGRDDTDYLHAVINNVIFLSVICCLIGGTLAAWRRRVRSAGPAAGSSSPAPRR